MPSKKAALREKWNNMDKDSVVLHMFHRTTTNPNASPYIVKFETFMRVAGIKYEEDFEQPMSTKGKSPWMTFNGEDMADSQLCMEHLAEKLDKDLNKNLTKEEKAVARGFRAMLEEHFYWCIVVLDYVANKGKYAKLIYAPFPVPKFLQGVAFNQMIKLLTKQAHAQGTGRHSVEEVTMMGNDMMQALSDYLGEKEYFFGNEATELDCTVFGFITNILAVHPDNDLAYKKKIEEDLPNLKSHFERMKERFWPDWDEKLYVPPAKPVKEDKKKEEKKAEEEGKDEEVKKEDDDADKDNKEEEKKDDEK